MARAYRCSPPVSSMARTRTGMNDPSGSLSMREFSTPSEVNGTRWPVERSNDEL